MCYYVLFGRVIGRVYWHHSHSFTAEPGGMRMVDVVDDELPLRILGALAHRFCVESSVSPDKGLPRSHARPQNLRRIVALA